MRLPLLISVPHAGRRTPEEVRDYSRLSEKDMIEDGDVGAREIYFPLEEHVAVFVTTDIARAFVDQNRAADDIRKDGVVKTHTCWDVPIYKRPIPEGVVETLLRKYHLTYQKQLRNEAEAHRELILAVDCHTMAAKGPPVGPDTGQKRPDVCLGNADGTCPHEWIEGLAEEFSKEFPGEVTINDPFSGGYITTRHAAEMPWVQLELSRAPFMSNAEKSRAVLNALTRWCERFTPGSTAR